MNSPFRQDARRGNLTTVLGPDELVLLHFSGSDRLNDLFEYHVEALSANKAVDFDKLLGTHATFTIKTPAGERHYDGIIAQAEWAGESKDGIHYMFTLRPWIWLAGLRRNQRIFHNKSVVEVLTTLLQPYAGLGKPAVDNRLTKSYPTLEYTVQYRESDLAFACRLMERFGINYHFTHDTGSHSLVMTDGVEGHTLIGERDYMNYVGRHPSDAEHFWQWRQLRGVTTGAVRLTDYNFKTPSAAMEVSQSGHMSHPQGAIESFDYPGDYPELGLGETMVGLRTRQERGQDARIQAEGDIASLCSGLRLNLSGDAIADATGLQFVCLATTHTYRAGGFHSGTQVDEQKYTAQYMLMPVTQPIAPRRKTPQPLVYGPQTAVVVGDGEIDCDQYGRILVRFHWDLDKAYSMRCRVSQNWAGKGWGGMVIPRIGMEVVVEFLEGDPDKPLVTGCVYNGNNTVPYLLPDNKTRSTFKTKTHEGTGFNELRFEDSKDKEEIFLHGQKDMNIKIEHHRSERVNVNKVESIGDSKASEVNNMLDQVVGGDFRVFVGPNQRGKITPGNASAEVQGLGGTTSVIGRGVGQNGSGNMEVTIEKDLSESVGRNVSQVLGKTKSTNVGDSYFIDVKKNYVLDVGQQITIKCGQSQITLDKDGNIAVNGKVGTITMDQLLKLLADIVKIN